MSESPTSQIPAMNVSVINAAMKHYDLRQFKLPNRTLTRKATKKVRFRKLLPQNCTSKFVIRTSLIRSCYFLIDL